MPLHRVHFFFKRRNRLGERFERRRECRRRSPIHLGLVVLRGVVDDQAQQVGPRVVSHWIRQRLRPVDQVQVDVAVHQAVQIRIRVLGELAPVGAKDPGRAATGATDRERCPRRGVALGVLLHAGLGDHLVADEDEGAAFEGVHAAGRDFVGLGAHGPGFVAQSVAVVGPGGDVDLFVLRVGVVLEQGLEVLPAVEHADFAQLGVGHRLQGVARRVAEHGALEVRRLDFAPVEEHVALVVDQDLGEVERAGHPLAEAQHDVHLVRRRGLADPKHFGPVCGHAVRHVLLHERDVLAVCTPPDEVRVAGDPELGKGDQGCSIAGCLLDEFDGPVDRALDVEPDGLGLGDGGLVFPDGHGAIDKRVLRTEMLLLVDDGRLVFDQSTIQKTPALAHREDSDGFKT